jgi:hypothetical protein
MFADDTPDPASDSNLADFLSHVNPGLKKMPAGFVHIL